MERDDERTWASLAHISPFLGYLTVAFGWVPPLIIWLVFKERSAHVGEQAKEALNLQITFWLAGLLFGLLCYVLIGIPLMMLLGVAYIVMPIVGAVNANNAEPFRYPFIFRLVP